MNVSLHLKTEIIYTKDNKKIYDIVFIIAKCTLHCVADEDNYNKLGLNH